MKKEILAYAITHAPRGQKGGPYDGCGMAGDKTPSLALAQRYGDTGTAREDAAWLVRRGHDARVIRIVRKARPSEASAVEVLRDMLATWDDRGFIRTEAFARARAVLAASGPDPAPVVRDLIMLVAGELDYDLAKSLDPETAEEPEEAERCMRDAVKRVAEQFTVARKAGGK